MSDEEEGTAVTVHTYIRTFLVSKEQELLIYCGSQVVIYIYIFI
jgi:hypothetical protein